MQKISQIRTKIEEKRKLTQKKILFKKDSMITKKVLQTKTEIQSQFLDRCYKLVEKPQIMV